MVDREAKYDLSLDEVIENKGYFDKYGEWNSIIRARKYPGLLFRGRVEVFIFRHDLVYILQYPNSTSYRVPGGSFDIRRSNHNQAYEEAKEEAKIITKNIRYTGVSYHKLSNHRYVSNTNKRIAWNGTYNKVYTADFAGLYSGSIDAHSRDNDMYHYGKFVPISSIYDNLIPEHKLAIDSKLKIMGVAPY